jgi:uncharacterized membrane protein
VSAVTKKDVLFGALILGGPFVTSLWTWEYIEAIRRHLEWVTDRTPDAVEPFAWLLALCAHGFLIGRHIHAHSGVWFLVDASGKVLDKCSDSFEFEKAKLRARASETPG